MRKIITLLLAALLTICIHAATPVTPKLPLKASEIYLPIGSGLMISLQDISEMSLKDFEKLTGKKMKFFDRIGFKFGQKKLRNSINYDGSFSKKKLEKYFSNTNGSGFHTGGFFLGLLLQAPIPGAGVVVSYLINDDLKKNRVKWAWIGFGTFWVVLIAFLALSDWNGGWGG